MVKTIKYSSLVSEVANATDYTYNKVHTVLKELSYVLTDAISRGNDIDCLGLFNIKYTYRGIGTIYNNPVVGYSEQLTEVVSRTGTAKDEVDIILKYYYKQLHYLLFAGYQISVKSIGYVEPQLNDDSTDIKLFSRISPALVKHKTLGADFPVLLEDGSLVVKQIPQSDLRFKLTLHDELEVPLALKDE